MLRIGLTGGLGSGKTTVASIFEVLGIPVYYADDASKRLMNEDEKIKEAIQRIFGKDTYSHEKLNTKYLAQIVFNDNKKLEVLNSIVHPATLKNAEEWIKQQTSPYIIKEAALLFESGSDKNLDQIIGVKAPLNLRLQRVIKRNSLTEHQAMARINKQMDEEKKLELCDFIIINDEQQLVIPQVINLHEKFIQLQKN